MKQLSYFFTLFFCAVTNIIIPPLGVWGQTLIATLPTDTEINCITESPDKMFIVLGGKDNFTLWHKNYAQKPLLTAKNHTEGVQFAHFLENENWGSNGVIKLLTGGGYSPENTMFLWNTENIIFPKKRKIADYQKFFVEQTIPPQNFNFNNHIKDEYNLKSNLKVEAVSCVVVVPRNKLHENILIVGSLEGKLNFYHADYYLEKFKLENPLINIKRKQMGLEPFYSSKSLSYIIPSKNQYYVRSLTIQQEDVLLIGTGIGSKKAGELIKLELSDPDNRVVVAKFNSPVAKITISPDKKTTVVCTDTGELFIFDQNFKLIKEYKDAKYAFPEFSPSKNELAVTKNGKNIEIWNMETFQKIQEWQAHTEKITALKWGIDGYYLYSAGNDQKLHIWLTIDIEKRVQELVSAKLDSFLKKDNFEKIADYNIRTSENSQKGVIQYYFSKYYNEISNKIFHAVPSQMEYDAESETIKLSGLFSPTFFAKVHPKTAKDLQKTLQEYLTCFRSKKLEFLPKKSLKNPEKIAQDAQIPVLVSGGLDVICGSLYDIWCNNQLLLTHKLDILANFNPLAGMKINKSIIKTTNPPTETSDIDLNIPTIAKNKLFNKDNVAVIIGNRDYQHTQTVDFALNDAQTMKKYLVQTLGYDDKNIIYVENAKSPDFALIFGTKTSYKGRLNNLVKPKKSEVFVYYAGHGAPDLNNDKKSYFVPVDTQMEYMELTAFDTDIFYDNLAQIPAKSITVIIDACFSGEGIYKNISPVRIKSKGAMGLKNGALMASCGADQVSAWYNEKGHSLFTYFFLKAIHNENADKNKDKKLTLSEIFQFIDDSTEGVPYFSRRLHNVQQNPVLKGQNVERVLVEY